MTPFPSLLPSSALPFDVILKNLQQSTANISLHISFQWEGIIDEKFQCIFHMLCLGDYAKIWRASDETVGKRGIKRERERGWVVTASSGKGATEFTQFILSIAATLHVMMICIHISAFASSSCNFLWLRRRTVMLSLNKDFP